MTHSHLLLVRSSVRRAALACALSLAACSEGPAVTSQPVEPAPREHAHGDHHHEPAVTGPAPTRVLDDGTRLFGAEPAASEPPRVELAALNANPAAYDGQVVRTEGRIERVCQRMGCWMELRQGESAPVRVPMAGHAFFLPRDVAGREATVEGRVALRELSSDAQRHLESEGATATASTLSIDASSVLVR